MRSTATIILTIVLALMLLAPATYAQRLSAERNATVDPSGADVINVTARAGTLVMEGDEKYTEVQVRGTARADAQDLLDQITLRAYKEGDTVYIEAQVPDGMNNAALDLEITLPFRLRADVEDSSGDAEISGLSGLNVEDNSGSLRVSGIVGDLTVEDSSGDLSISGVTNGAVRVSDSSGDMQITGVNGAVTITEDSSGDIRVTGVSGPVEIGQDSSGGIYMEGISGDITIREDSSGDIDVRAVAGNFTVERKGSGDVRHSNVAGQVRIASN